MDGVDMLGSAYLLWIKSTPITPLRKKQNINLMTLNMWGFNKFLNLNKLCDPKRGYLVNDTCVLEVDLTVPEIIDRWLPVEAKGGKPKADKPSRGKEPQPRSFSTNGWKFSFNSANITKLDGSIFKLDLEMPQLCNDFELCIMHLDTGIKFIFSDADALTKWILEKYPDHKLPSDLSTYDSPLKPADGFDSAYVGKTIFENSVEKLWTDVEWGSLGQQVLWADKHRRKAGMSCHDFRLPQIMKHEKKQKFKGHGVQHPLAHLVVDLYSDTSKQGNSSCQFKLVVTPCGWFFHLWQLFCNDFGARRTREMTMLCRFKDNIVHREIIEKQSNNFKDRLRQNVSKKERRRANLGQAEIHMLVKFHELKKMNIQGGHASDVVEMFFANSGELVKRIEAETRTRIQIIPVFRPLHHPTAGTLPRRVYVFGTKGGVNYAKSPCFIIGRLLISEITMA